ncbi:tRNA (adenosine(37)-N6)-threonylcarbamoyltransferase complex dimerization subunit type 1 TsaB [Marihabitans asiaticum]|uniref:tRNA threonylcarbamoyl adenosine modification protein YeaZ n=1 Tax=Marihabitans asiaticum TaxID=415218 RepID=A0A560WD17_9MICO|nr:tRNA threonylcarbamoyl adenosine modification protein YeaZ [Marihabitans asiaticum]
MLLALDTSTSAITVAVLGLDGGLLAEQTVIDPRATTEQLAPLIERALREADATPGDITLVAVGTGPGPFTGLRVGIVTGRSFAHARSIPVLGVPSHDAMAQQWFFGGAEGTVLVATDARRKEVYTSVYDRVAPEDEDHLIWARTAGPEVRRPQDLPEHWRGLPTLGRGPHLYPDHLPQSVGPLDVSAAALGGVALARYHVGEDQPTEPLYLRRPDAADPGRPASTLRGEGGPPAPKGRP